MQYVEYLVVSSVVLDTVTGTCQPMNLPSLASDTSTSSGNSGIQTRNCMNLACRPYLTMTDADEDPRDSEPSTNTNPHDSDTLKIHAQTRCAETCFCFGYFKCIASFTMSAADNVSLCSNYDSSRHDHITKSLVSSDKCTNCNHIRHDVQIQTSLQFLLIFYSSTINLHSLMSSKRYHHNIYNKTKHSYHRDSAHRPA